LARFFCFISNQMLLRFVRGVILSALSLVMVIL
jgi:hypothetical protein